MNHHYESLWVVPGVGTCKYILYTSPSRTVSSRDAPAPGTAHIVHAAIIMYSEYIYMRSLQCTVYIYAATSMHSGYIYAATLHYGARSLTV